MFGRDGVQIILPAGPLRPDRRPASKRRRGALVHVHVCLCHPVWTTAPKQCRAVGSCQLHAVARAVMTRRSCHGDDKGAAVPDQVQGQGYCSMVLKLCSLSDSTVDDQGKDIVAVAAGDEWRLK